MRLLTSWQARLDALPGRPSKAVDSAPRLPRAVKPRARADMLLRASLPQGRETRGGRNQLLASLAFAAQRGNFAHRGPARGLVAAARHLA